MYDVGDLAGFSNQWVESPQTAGDAVDDPAKHGNGFDKVIDWEREKLKLAQGDDKKHLLTWSPFHEVMAEPIDAAL